MSPEMYDNTSYRALEQVISGVNIDNINRSYFVGTNDELGWTLRHYFTFFGEFQRSDNVLSIVEAVIISLIFIIAITVKIIRFYCIM
jgi:hypothetical protein